MNTHDCESARSIAFQRRNPPAGGGARPMTVETLQTDTPARFQLAVKRAADLLRAGGVVALPT